MDKYELIKEIGSGTFGSVLKAANKKTGEFVAVKKMKQKYYTWDECVKLAEVQALRKFSSHPNIVRLKEVVRENNTLFFVFEFLDGDLLGRLREHKTVGGGLPHHLVKSYTLQLLNSLQFLHRCGYFHRDLKPENILIKRSAGDLSGGRDILKLADFGLVKEIRARPPFTDYVSTRWYRAPEILLQDRAYSSPVDLWAVGCMMAELYTTRPLFPGSNEVDQMFKIVSVTGTPTESHWSEGLSMARKINYRFPTVAPVALEKVLPASIPADAIDLMKQLLVLNPRKRLTATQALNHPFFNSGIEEDTRIRPSPAGLPAATRTGKIPSAPSPHMSKQVAWREQRVVEELANPSLAKPSSSEGPRLPPVPISKYYPGGGNTPQQQQQQPSVPVLKSTPKQQLGGRSPPLPLDDLSAIEAMLLKTSPTASGGNKKPYNYAMKQFEFTSHWQGNSPNASAGPGGNKETAVPQKQHRVAPLVGSGSGERPPMAPSAAPVAGQGSARSTTVETTGPPLAPVPVRKSPSPTRDIVDQALEELLMGGSPGGGKALLFGGGSSASKYSGGGGGTTTGGNANYPSSVSGSARAGAGGGVSPVSALLNEAQYRPTDTAGTGTGGTGTVSMPGITSSGLRDRSNVPRWNANPNSMGSGGKGGSFSGKTGGAGAISPSVTAILQRRQQQQQQHGPGGGGAGGAHALSHRRANPQLQGRRLEF